MHKKYIEHFAFDLAVEKIAGQAFCDLNFLHYRAIKHI